MDAKWVLLSEIKYQSPDGIKAVAEIKEDSPWFSGHFPGQPILPAIAMMAFAWRAIELFGEKKGILFIPKEARRIRFKQLVRPPQKIYVKVRFDQEKRGFHFVVDTEKGLAASGIFFVEQS